MKEKSKYFLRDNYEKVYKFFYLSFFIQLFNSSLKLEFKQKIDC
jgi:hypothetical protein